jgi:hypothetical protein
MPNFDFMVGVSIAFALKRAAQSSDNRTKWSATYKATVRAFRLFILGILTQCGVGLMQYQLSQLRIMGILQRVALCYYVAALFEIWLTPRDPPTFNKEDNAANDSIDDYDDDISEYDDDIESFGGSRLSVAKVVQKEMTTMGAIVKYYRWQYVGVLLLVGAHLGIMYGAWR